MAEAEIHTEKDSVSAEAAAGRLRADGIPVRVTEEFPYMGAPLRYYRLLVPEHLSRQARRSLGIVEREDVPDRRGLYALIVLMVVALAVAALGLMQRLG